MVHTYLGEAPWANIVGIYTSDQACSTCGQSVRRRAIRGREHACVVRVSMSMSLCRVKLCEDGEHACDCIDI